MLQTAAGLPGGQGRVGLAGHQPGGAVVGVPVPLVVHRDDVHQHDVLGVLIHPGERDPDGGKHPPEERLCVNLGKIMAITEVVAETRVVN